MTPKEEYNATIAKSVIKKLEQRNMEGHYCPTKEAAVSLALDIIKEGSSIAWGGSMTVKEIALFDALNTNNYNLIDRALAKDDDELQRIYRSAFNADYFLMSSNAITLDGELINIDGTGNRVAALIFGPKNVIVFAGMNKITKDVNAGLDRIKNYSAPLNAIRLDCKTPCNKTGTCRECISADSICCQTVITRVSRIKNRIKVILIGEDLGY